MSMIAWAGLIVAVVGTGVSVSASMQQAAIAKKTGAYNAKLAENQALQAEMDGRENLRRKRVENRRFLARQRAGLAKAGVLETGTPLEVMAESAGSLELEALDYTRQQAMTATGLRAQGAMDKAMGGAQARAAYTQAGASLLSGTARALSMMPSGAPSGGGGSGGFIGAAPISGTSASFN
jgi:hypothetical protein